MKTVKFTADIRDFRQAYNEQQKQMRLDRVIDLLVFAGVFAIVICAVLAVVALGY